MRATDVAFVSIAVTVALTRSLCDAQATALDWSFCDGHGSLPLGSTGSSLLCPNDWPGTYPACAAAAGAQAPVNFAGASMSVDSQLRPLDLRWALSRRFNISLTPGALLELLPVDIRPSFWDPNSNTPYALESVAFYSPSQHAIGGARRDLEVHFVHRERTGGDGRQLIVAMLFDSSPVRADNEALRGILFPIVAAAASAAGTPAIDGTFDLRADFAALAPQSRGYVRYVASGPHPPCAAGTVYYVMDEIGAVSHMQVNRMRAALGLSTVDGLSATHMDSAPPVPSGNVRPLVNTLPSGGDDAPRRFLDFVGEHVYSATPKPDSLNERLDDISLAALVLSCASVLIALAAARLSYA